MREVPGSIPGAALPCEGLWEIRDAFCNVLLLFIWCVPGRACHASVVLPRGAYAVLLLRFLIFALLVH